jgi:hypothetical protein
MSSTSRREPEKVKAKPARLETKKLVRALLGSSCRQPFPYGIMEGLLGGNSVRLQQSA